MNPFLKSTFWGRTREINDIIDSITSGGQSVAITGEDRVGKSSLLRHLTNPKLRLGWYGDLATQLIFNEIDVQIFSSTLTPSQFWQKVLTPLEERLAEIANPALNIALANCKSREYEAFELEPVFAQLQEVGWRIVVLLDEFDNLLNHPILHKAEFYGGLRSLATRYESLTLIIACRQTLGKLNESTRDYSKKGSPYFNFMYQLTIGALEEKDALSFLECGDKHFSKADKNYLLFITGGHPFLLQYAAYALWRSYENGETERQTRWESTARDLIHNTRSMFDDAWINWSPESRKAITIIALDTLPRLISEEFDMDMLLSHLADYPREVDELKNRGFLAIDHETRSGYKLQAQVMLWWLAGELIQDIRLKDNEDLGGWLRKQEWDGIIKGEEKYQLNKVLTAVSGLLRNGSEAFVKASAEGFAKGLMGVK